VRRPVSAERAEIEIMKENQLDVKHWTAEVSQTGDATLPDAAEI
jgi:hypothetical protein